MSARPGRIYTEIAIDVPMPRTDPFRTSAEYAAYCRKTSDALQAAMEARP
jgi:NitT/TauT family transport system ATP-binding protein